MKQNHHSQELEDDLRRALEVLREGGLILYPTDTIWGIGCDATNAEAVKKVYELKKRDDSKALIVLIDNPDMLDHYVVNVPYMAQELMDVAVKPLTIIYEGAYNLPANLLGENDSIGIRVTRERFSQLLCSRLGKPLVSTSANVSGAPQASTFKEIDPAIINGVDYVVKYRQDDSSVHEASNIILLRSDGTFCIIR